MDDISKKFDEQNKKLEAIYISTEKTRKYLLWTLIIAVVVTLLPLLGLIFAIPAFLSVYNVSGI